LRRGRRSGILSEKVDQRDDVSDAENAVAVHVTSACLVLGAGFQFLPCKPFFLLYVRKHRLLERLDVVIIHLAVSVDVARHKHELVALDVVSGRIHPGLLLLAGL